MEFRDAELNAQVYREADWAQQLGEHPGWQSLARWVTEQAALEANALEMGVASWDDYQRSVGRLDAYRKVLGRPEDLVAEAARLVRGDSE